MRDGFDFALILKLVSEKSAGIQFLFHKFVLLLSVLFEVPQIIRQVHETVPVLVQLEPLFHEKESSKAVPPIMAACALPLVVNSMPVIFEPVGMLKPKFKYSCVSLLPASASLLSSAKTALGLPQTAAPDALGN